jgi:predicted RNA binding protein YcfA (HicA-like mRNA interferase family)
VFPEIPGSFQGVPFEAHREVSTCLDYIRREIDQRSPLELLGLCQNCPMKRPFSATIWRAGDWFVSQCLDVDVASQGRTEEEALDICGRCWNCTSSRRLPRIPLPVRQIEIEVGRLKPLASVRSSAVSKSACFSEVRQKGSHVKLARMSGERTDTVIVPRHHEIPAGTPRSILNQAHIDSESWGKL